MKHERRKRFRVRAERNCNALHCTGVIRCSAAIALCLKCQAALQVIIGVQAASKIKVASPQLPVRYCYYCRKPHTLDQFGTLEHICSLKHTERNRTRKRKKLHPLIRDLQELEYYEQLTRQIKTVLDVWRKKSLRLGRTYMLTG